MRPHLTLFLGIFAVMALSNAIVPVLPFFDPGPAMQGMIYAAYFLGAFFITLPAGVYSDKYGRIPFIRLGLAISVTSGIFLTMAGGAIWIIILRFIEGTGAGLFVAAALSAVNHNPDHVRLSGWYMACLNAGLVAGLLGAGWLAATTGNPQSGILLFTLMAFLPAISSFFVDEPGEHHIAHEPDTVIDYIMDYRWLWYSSLILVGITGVLTSLCPEYSDASPDVIGFWIAGMSVATIAAVVIFSRTDLSPVPAIRWSAVLMGAAVLITFVSSSGFLIIGALAGIVMIAQMAFLSGVQEHQGIVMGLFSTTSYLGMAVLPAAAGFIAENAGFEITFMLTALAALTVAATIGFCNAKVTGPNGPEPAATGKEQ